MKSSTHENTGVYAAAGVDEEREQVVFRQAMLPLLQGLTMRNERVRGLAGVATGHFATVIQIDEGPAIAITTDGVGTKILIARMANSFESIGVDCVANNVNDLICIGADPIALLDYIAIDRIDEGVLGQIARGLARGAETAGIAIPGGEIAQIGAMLGAPSGYGDGPHLDIVGTAIGLLPSRAVGEPPKLLDGEDVTPGDIVLGLASSGLHSNGYSLARRALFEHGHLDLTYEVPGSGKTVADALLEPTRIYVPAMRQLWSQNLSVHGLVNISGGGLLNLLRLPAKVGFMLDELPAPPAIFKLIKEAGDIESPEMFATFNMGIGACIIVPQANASDVVSSLEETGETVYRLGRVTDDSDQTVVLTQERLIGKGDTFS